MIYKLGSCSSDECNESKECKYSNKILKCCRTNQIYFYSLDSHNIQERSKGDRNRGLNKAFKELIEQLIFEQSRLSPTSN